MTDVSGPKEAKSYVDDLYAVFFNRIPEKEEREHWIGLLSHGLPDREVFHLFKQSKEYSHRTRVKLAYPPGHYYSPVVDPAEASKYLRVDRNADPASLVGIDISMPMILRMWEQLKPFLSSCQLPWKKTFPFRYFANNTIYPIGDAAILRAMILLARPRHIIEIGSGFSSACMLDTLDEAKSINSRLTFIEPYPARLRSLLREEDYVRCEIIEAPVQSVDPTCFDELDENDIVFIDSTHVLKAGSDVHYELFEVLPRLKPGVLVHFHDIHYPFEYPKNWILELAYSWNEIYALRAFLMYNTTFRIEFFNSLFATRNPDLVTAVYPDMLRNPGGAIWLRKLR